MLKIKKLTDYSTIILAYIAKNKNTIISAKILAQKTKIPVPTVSKLLKILTKKQIIISKRGINGGYAILKNPHHISIAEMILAIEGPIAITNCIYNNSSNKLTCNIKHSCPMHKIWKHINNTILITLEKISLAHISKLIT